LGSGLVLVVELERVNYPTQYYREVHILIFESVVPKLDSPEIKDSSSPRNIHLVNNFYLVTIVFT